MILSSRPEEDIDIVGSGPFLMRFDIEELQLIASLLFVTRLGKGDLYKEAAFRLMDNIDTMMGDDFMEESADDVNAYFSVVDDQDNILASHHFTDICIEV